MQKSKVALAKCDAYNFHVVAAAVEKGLALLGVLEHFIFPEERVLIKPNVVAGEDPSHAVSPLPGVFRALAEHALHITETVCYGDSPGVGRISTAMKTCGLADTADELGIPLADFENGR